MNPRSWFRRKKKKKKEDEQELTIFGEPKTKEIKESYLNQGREKMRSVKRSLSKLSPSTTIRYGFLRPIKRFIAIILMIVFLPTSFLLLPDPLSFLFFGNTFILLDYLLKTRRSEWSKVDPVEQE